MPPIPFNLDSETNLLKPPEGPHSGKKIKLKKFLSALIKMYQGYSCCCIANHSPQPAKSHNEGVITAPSPPPLVFSFWPSQAASSISSADIKKDDGEKPANVTLLLGQWATVLHGWLKTLTPHRQLWPVNRYSLEQHFSQQQKRRMEKLHNNKLSIFCERWRRRHGRNGRPFVYCPFSEKVTKKSWM